ncbi:MAG: hypothetical protein JSS89_08755 [Bacteroidetes bacterium]|nr:hypothetical protein [Bacteroidota bacterium]
MNLFKRISVLAILLASLASLVPMDAFAQRRGGSFGGSRSGGGGRSFGGSRPSGGGGSFGRSRPSTRPYSGSYQRNSYGSSRSSSSNMPRYGTPLRQEARTMAGNGGANTRYVFNNYGGMGDRFMMGYMMGSMPWYYGMPFHPAFYYARPYQVVNPDGTVSVYPGQFQWGTLFFMLLLFVGIIFILYVAIQSRKRRRFEGGGGSSDDGDDWSRSSFA